MKVLVTGSRDYTSKETILKAILEIEEPIDVIIHGAAKGADSIAQEVADYLNIPTTPVPAQWNKFGKIAGVIRNAVMLSMLDPTKDIVLAFHEDINISKGTKDMVLKAVRKKVKTILYTNFKDSPSYPYYPAQLDLT